MAWIWVLIHNNYVWIKHYIYLIRKQTIYYLNLQHIHGSPDCLHNKIGVLSITIMRTLSNHITKRFFKFNKKNCNTWHVNLSVQCHVTNLRWFIKVALGVCFALKSWKEYLLLCTYLITLGKDVTFPLITKFKTNRPLSYLFVNRIPN